MTAHKVIAERSIWRKLLASQEILVLIPLVVLCVGATLVNPAFLNPRNLGAMARTMAPWGVLAVGQSLIIIAGEIDISVGSMVSLGTVFFAYSISSWGLPVHAAILLVCLLTMTLSFVTGYCVVKLKIPAFLASIAMLYICRGFASAITNARPVSLFTAPLRKKTAEFLHWGQLEFYNINIAFVTFLVLVVFFQFILRKTAYGRKLYATGDNMKVAALAGVSVDWVKISTFLISGLLVGLTAVLVAGKEGVGSPRYGEGWELTVVAATAIGGISLVGGSGTMIGTLFGVIMMAAISNVLILVKVNQHYQSVTLGVIIALSVILDVQRRIRLFGK